MFVEQEDYFYYNLVYNDFKPQKEMKIRLLSLAINAYCDINGYLTSK